MILHVLHSTCMVCIRHMYIIILPHPQGTVAGPALVDWSRIPHSLCSSTGRGSVSWGADWLSASNFRQGNWTHQKVLY